MAAAPRTLSPRALNRALLARQLLLERSTAPLPRALERIGGIQAQYAPSMYVGLWSRLEGFEREALDRALERGSVVQGTMMRSTIHLVSAGDYWPLVEAIGEARREHWLRTRKDHTAREVEAATRRVRRRISGAELRGRALDEIAGGRVLAGGVGHWLPLLRVPPSGTWEHRRADLYASAADRLGPPAVTPAEGIELVVRRYLGGFGPAPAADIAGWAGIPPRDVAPALERMRLRRFRDEDGGELFDLPRAALPSRYPGARRFLPVGTRRCSSSPKSTGRRSSTPARPTPSTPSSSTARWRAPGGTRRAGSRSSRSDASPRATGLGSRPRRNGSSRSTPSRRTAA